MLPGPSAKRGFDVLAWRSGSEGTFTIFSWNRDTIMRYAICNETFEGWDHGKVCQTVAELGYEGLEMAPFTLAPRITDVTSGQRRGLRQQAKHCGLQIIGLHWLLAKTEGLQLTATDPAVRQRTADYLVELARCCRDLGGELMVFGSPAQRRIPTGATREQATDHAVDTFGRAAAGIADTGVTLCLEPLAPAETGFRPTAAEAVAILDRLAHPRLVPHLSVKVLSAGAVSIP